MRIEELKAEKEKINKISENFISNLLEIIEENQKEIYKYKLERDRANKAATFFETELIKSKVEVDNLQKQLENLRDDLCSFQKENLLKDKKIEELREEIIKTEYEIYNTKKSEGDDFFNLIDELKSAFLEDDEIEVEEVLEEILESIEELERKISYEDMILLMYCCYFYDKLDELLRICLIAHSYYLEKNSETRLLRVLKEEEESSLYSRVNECAQKYLKNNLNLFNKLDMQIKEKLISKISEMSYKYFSSVYKETDQDISDSVISIKCWVREANSNVSILVNAKYSYKEEKIYLPEALIQEQDLNLAIISKESKNKIVERMTSSQDKEKLRINKCLDKLKESFNTKTADSIELYMTQKKNDKEINILKEILKENISPKTISLKDAYTLLVISEFYGLLKFVTENSSYLNSLYKAKCPETRLIDLMENEIGITNNKVIEMPVTVFVEKNSEKMLYIDQAVKDKAFSLIDSLYYDVFKRVSADKNLVAKCSFDGETIYFKSGFIKVNDTKYIFISARGCHKCNTLYISKKRYAKINKNYGLEENTSTIINNNEIENKKIYNNKYNEWYNSILKAFSLNNVGRALQLYNKQIFNADMINSFDRTQVITLMFIGYLIKHKVNDNNEEEVRHIKSNYDLGNSIEIILYDRLCENVYLNDYIEQYSTSLKSIDAKVKQKILEQIILIGNEMDNSQGSIAFENQSNNILSSINELEGNSLNAESVIKKMGYTTSLSREVRWNILKNKAIPKLGKNKVIGHLNFLVKMNKKRSVMANAVQEWLYDLERLNQL